MEIWYRAFGNYTPENYGGGTDEFFCIVVDEPITEQKRKETDNEAIRRAKEWAKDGDDFADVGHVDIDLISVDEVDGEQECFPEIRSVWL